MMRSNEKRLPRQFYFHMNFSCVSHIFRTGSTWKSYKNLRCNTTRKQKGKTKRNVGVGLPKNSKGLCYAQPTSTVHAATVVTCLWRMPVYLAELLARFSNYRCVDKRHAFVGVAGENCVVQS